MTVSSPAIINDPSVESDLPVEIDELFRRIEQLDGKAEIVNGGLFVMSPTQPWPSEVAAEIFVALRAWARKMGIGRAVTDNALFRVNLPHRQSFSPDAAYHTGNRLPTRCYEGAPVFAVEVRSFGDYGPAAEERLADKRADYFACGTRIVWDVDLQSNAVIRSYSPAQPQTPVIFRPGEIAHAEPAVPGWTVAVNDILPDDWTPPGTPTV